MYCSNCGKQINNENVYCTNCGAKILEAEKQEDSSKDTKVIRITLKRMITMTTLIVIFVFIIVSAILFINKTSTVPLADKPNINYNSNISDNNIAKDNNTVNNINKNNSISNSKNTINNTISNNTNTSENNIKSNTSKEEAKEYGVWKYRTVFNHDYQKSLWEKFEVKFMYYSENYYIEIPTVSKYPNLNKELQKLKAEVFEYAKTNPNLYSYSVKTDITGYADNDNLFDFHIVRTIKEKRDVGFAKSVWYSIRYDIEKDYIIYVKNFDGVITVDTPIENGTLQY